MVVVIGPLLLFSLSGGFRPRLNSCHVAERGEGEGSKRKRWGWRGRTSEARSLGRAVFACWGGMGRRPVLPPNPRTRAEDGASGMDARRAETASGLGSRQPGRPSGGMPEDPRHYL